MARPPRGAEAPTRRSMLAGTGALAVSALAGCLGGFGGSGDGDSGGSSGPGTTDSMGTGSTTTSDASTLEEHPAAAGLESQPIRGTDPFEAEATIIAFEDPSCHRCRVFERQTVPKIESELVAGGTASFVFRGYPVIYPWGKPATQALESTFALVAYYVREHGLSLQSGGGSAVGAFLGVLGAGCAACGPAVLLGLLSLVGAAGALTLLPFGGWS